MPFLFSYGTLQQTNVQLATFGRELTGVSDSLVDYEQSLSPSPIQKSCEPAARPITQSPNMVCADRYEVSAYRRVTARLSSGRTAWVYVDTRHGPPD